MKATLKVIATCVNDHKDELSFHKALAEIKTAINDGRLLEEAKSGAYAYDVYLSEKPKIKYEDKIKEELGALGLDCICFCTNECIQTVTITWY